MLAKLLATIAGSLAASLLCGAFARGQEYTSTSELAVKNNLPLIVFLDCEQRGIAGALVCRTQKLPGYAGPAIVVSVPGGDWMLWRCTLPATATDAEIMSAIRGPDALAEVNAARASRGLRPFLRDDGLMAAAESAARWRAARRVSGHTSNDFGHVPAGSHADAAGCAAWEPSMGWGSCCAYEDWAYAGAGIAIGADGLRYMHLFVRR